MKRKIINILTGLLFLIGLAVLAYPTVSNQWNTFRQQRLISEYKNVLGEITQHDIEEEWKKARTYNNSFSENNIYGDVFDTSDVDIEDTEYWKILNINQDGIMGYMTIPKINLKLSIYHGTADDVLETGIGHLNGTKLPIGGESTHSVLSAHRGLPSAKLFTDLDQMQVGDKFYIHVLDQHFAYEVDQILPMVDKDDKETLQDALKIEKGQDYVTLFTCTPYGVNSHRLLVRGHSVPYDEEVATTPMDTMVESVQNYYMLYLILGLAVTLLVILLMKKSYRKREKQKDSDA